MAIIINGNPIMARSAVNKGPRKNFATHLHKYELDDGSEVFHDPNDGAVKLAIKMLKTIQEQTND